MEAVRDAVAAGRGDDELTAAVYACGRRAFLRAAAQGFSLSLAARGDVAAAAELVRLGRHERRGRGWCEGGTLRLARRALGDAGSVEVHCDGEDRVLIRGPVVSGSPGAAAGALREMLSGGRTAEALAHARVVCGTQPAEVFSAAMASEAADARARRYVALLREVHGLACCARARRALADAAVAFGSGDIKVRPPSLRESEERLRVAALYTVARAPRGGSRRGSLDRAPREAAVKTLDIAWESEGSAAPSVEVIKC